MAKFTEFKEIPLNDLVISTGQARTVDLGADIEELAESINSQGLLQPIVVCPASEEGKWEILIGQRRFLAHKRLHKDNILAAIIDEHVGKDEAKTISITENLIRRKLTNTELIDGITHLYNYYGTIKSVVEKTGLSRGIVQDYVKYPRLIREIKEMVDHQGLNINVAIKAQDAATFDDKIDVETAVKIAKEMEPMTGVQRKKVVKQIKEDPKKPIEEVIEDAKGPSKVTQIFVTVSNDTLGALKQYARKENLTQDEAALDLLESGLIEHGFLNESQ